MAPDCPFCGIVSGGFAIDVRRSTTPSRSQLDGQAEAIRAVLVDG